VLGNLKIVNWLTPSHRCKDIPNYLCW